MAAMPGRHWRLTSWTASHVRSSHHLDRRSMNRLATSPEFDAEVSDWFGHHARCESVVLRIVSP
jgi:hypothetical protein